VLVKKLVKLLLNSCQLVSDYSHTDCNGFLASHDFTSYFDITDVGALWLYLKKLLQQALNQFLPKVTLKSHQWPKWFTSTLQHQLNCLHILRRKYSKIPTTSCWAQIFSTAKYEYEIQLIHKLSMDNNFSIYKYNYIFFY